jgi:hypothetical protein
MKLSDFLHDLTTAIKIFDLDYDCFSIGQLKSKQWLVEILKDVRMIWKLDFGTIYVLCGWYGILSAMLFLEFEIDRIRSFDIDERCEKIADQVNKIYSSDEWRFKAITQDILDINFEVHSWQCWSNKNNRMSKLITDIPNTIINTSCEHMSPEWFDNVPPGKLVALQSNDSFTEEGHINAVTSVDEFKDMFPLSTIYYDGQIDFKQYKRFMLVGVK